VAPPGSAAPGASQLARLCGRVRRTGFHAAGATPLRPHNGAAAAAATDVVPTQRIELVERMEPRDMDAAELVLKCMYKGAVPAEVTGDVVALLRGARMAARFQVRRFYTFFCLPLYEDSRHGPGALGLAACPL
jgi:hypothetical protein